MNNFVDTYLARIVGVLVASLCSWLAVKYGFKFDNEAQGKIVENIVGIMQLMWGLVYIFTHRTTSKQTNPGDAASSHLAAVEKKEAQQLKS
jgi:hypothetical protein